MGGQYDTENDIWRFRASTTFELKGGVMRLRAAGLLPLELWDDGGVEAVWVDYDLGDRIMQWRPVVSP